MNNKLKLLLLNLLVSLVIFSLIITLFVEQLSVDSLTQALSAISSISPRSYTLYGGALFLFFAFRSWRYALLLTLQGKQKHADNKRLLFYATVARGAMVDLMPFRTGEAGFIALLKSHCKLDVGSGTSVVIVASVLDFITLACISLVLFLSIIGGINSLIMIAVGVVAFVFLLKKSAFKKAHYALSQYAKKTEKKHTQRLLGFYTQLLNTMVYCLEKHAFYQLLALSFSHRFCRLLSLFILFNAIGFSFDSNHELFNYWQSLSIIVASETTGALPLPNALGFGLWESGGVAYSALISSLTGPVFVLLLSVHVCQKVIGTSLSIVALVLINLTAKK